MSNEATVDALKALCSGAARNQGANELRRPFVLAISEVIASRPLPVDVGQVCCALMFIASDYLLHYYPPAMHEPMLAALNDLLARSVRDRPEPPL